MQKINCPQCQKPMKIYVSKSSKVRCPSCQHKFLYDFEEESSPSQSPTYKTDSTEKKVDDGALAPHHSQTADSSPHQHQKITEDTCDPDKEHPRHTKSAKKTNVAHTSCPQCSGSLRIYDAKRPSWMRCPFCEHKFLYSPPRKTRQHARHEKNSNRTSQIHTPCPKCNGSLRIDDVEKPSWMGCPFCEHEFKYYPTQESDKQRRQRYKEYTADKAQVDDAPPQSDPEKSDQHSKNTSSQSGAVRTPCPECEHPLRIYDAKKPSWMKCPFCEHEFKHYPTGAPDKKRKTERHKVYTIGKPVSEDELQVDLDRAPEPRTYVPKPRNPATADARKKYPGTTDFDSRIPRRTPPSKRNLLVDLVTVTSAILAALMAAKIAAMISMSLFIIVSVLIIFGAILTCLMFFKALNITGLNTDVGALLSIIQKHTALDSLSQVNSKVSYITTAVLWAAVITIAISIPRSLVPASPAKAAPTPPPSLSQTLNGMVKIINTSLSSRKISGANGSSQLSEAAQLVRSELTKKFRGAKWVFYTGFSPLTGRSKYSKGLLLKYSCTQSLPIKSKSWAVHLSGVRVRIIPSQTKRASALKMGTSSSVIIGQISSIFVKFAPPNKINLFIILNNARFK